jgi:hypothetical protein
MHVEAHTTQIPVAGQGYSITIIVNLIMVVLYAGCQNSALELSPALLETNGHGFKSRCSGQDRPRSTQVHAIRGSASLAEHILVPY